MAAIVVAEIVVDSLIVKAPHPRFLESY